MYDNNLSFFGLCCQKKGVPSGQFEIKTAYHSWATDSNTLYQDLLSGSRAMICLMMAGTSMGDDNGRQ
jgi:hypothetical protein